MEGGGVVVAGTGDDCAPGADGVFHLAVETRLFRKGQGRALAGGAGDHQAVGAGVQQGPGETLGLRVVNLPGGVKGGDHSGNQSANFSRHNASLRAGGRGRRRRIAWHRSAGIIHGMMAASDSNY